MLRRKYGVPHRVLTIVLTVLFFAIEFEPVAAIVLWASHAKIVVLA